MSPPRFNPGFWSLLFRFLGRVRGTRDAPGVVFFLGLGNALKRGLVGLLVDLRFLLLALLVAAPLPLATTPTTHLGVRGHRDQRQYRHYRSEGLHYFCLPAIPRSQTVLQPNDGKP